MWIPGPAPYMVPPHCHYNPSKRSWLLGGRGHSEIIFGVDPESAVTCATHLGASPHTPTDKAINLLRDYRPTKGVFY